MLKMCLMCYNYSVNMEAEIKMKDINKIKLFLLDMDGTFYLGNEIIDGALQFLDVVKKQGKDFIFLTNNSSKNKYAYQEKLKSMGCNVDAERIFTSGEATTIYLNSIAKGAKIFLLGTELLHEEFEKAGFVIVNETEARPDYVVLGFDTTLTYDKLWKACDFLREGVGYIATHPDFNCPLEDNKYMPDTGAMIELVAASTGRRPHVVGKPNKDIIEAVCIKYGCNKDEIAMVGDRLYTDIKMGETAGITSVLVLTGETSRQEYEKSDIKADYVYESIKELAEEIG